MLDLHCMILEAIVTKVSYLIWTDLAFVMQ